MNKWKIKDNLFLLTFLLLFWLSVKIRTESPFWSKLRMSLRNRLQRGAGVAGPNPPSGICSGRSSTISSMPFSKPVSKSVELHATVTNITRNNPRIWYISPRNVRISYLNNNYNLKITIRLKILARFFGRKTLLWWYDLGGDYRKFRQKT